VFLKPFGMVLTFDGVEPQSFWADRESAARERALLSRLDVLVYGSATPRELPSVVAV
jgi:hypothetical protein